MSDSYILIAPVPGHCISVTFIKKKFHFIKLILRRLNFIPAYIITKILHAEKMNTFHKRINFINSTKNWNPISLVPAFIQVLRTVCLKK